MTETVRRFLAFVEPGHRAVWLGLALLALVVTGLEVAAALLIFVVTRLVAGAGVTLDLPLVGDPRARFPGLTDQQMLVFAMAAIAGFFVIRAGIVLIESYLRARVAEGTGVRLSSRLFRGYLRMPYPLYLQRNSAELIRNVDDAVKYVVEFTLIPAVRIASEMLVVVGLAVALVLTAPLAAALAVALFLPLMAVLFRVVQPRISRLGEISHNMNMSALGALQQALHGFRDITVLGRREYFNEQYDKIRGEIGRARYRRTFLGDIPRIALETGLVLFVAVFIAVVAGRGGSTEDSLAVLGLFAYAALRILPSLNRVVLQINDLRFGAAAAADVHRDLVAVETASPTLANGTDDGGWQSMTPRRRIYVDDVSYRYPEAHQDALVGVRLEIETGRSIGVVGPTGGGKSTLLDVMLGLLPPTEGRVLVDDADIRQDLDAWQRNLGVVPQAVYLLDTTLRRNIALGLPDDAIEEDRVSEAVRLSQLEAFVASLPMGLDTLVGERGVKISGGERQRVAIARALYRQPSVLIFDEGTSALDAVTEADLLRALEPLRQTHTLIIVAHRLTTVRDCDRIVIVESGRIVDTGSYDELLDRNPQLRRMVSATTGPVEVRDASPS